MPWPAIVLGGLYIANEVRKALPAIMAVRQAIKDSQPVIEDEVIVEVIGQPGVTKQQLYFLALAAANGVVTRLLPLGVVGNLVSNSYGMLMAEYDATDNWVRCTIKYTSGVGAALAANIDPTSGRTLFDSLVIYRGPQCNVNGSVFNFVSTDPTAFGVPANATAKSAPQLPFAGQPIVTSCPTTPTPQPTPISQNPAPSAPITNAGPVINSPNPKPPGDNRSRGAVLTNSISSGSSTSLSSGQNFNGALQGGIGFSSSGSSGTSDKCCTSVLALIPLIFAALSAPSTNSDMTFPLPTQGPTGG